MTGLRSRFLVLVFFCLAVAAPAHAEKRVALVIGNGFYQYQPILSNPKHDAEDVAEALHDLNFDVVLGLDLTHAGMNEKLDEFSRKADGADIAFVYYSGHGMQFGGFNYLLPVDASLDGAADVNPFRLVRIDNVMETLSTVNGPKIVVLDACRDNPVEKELKRRLAALRGVKGAEVTRGLSPISASVSGLLVAYATQADETALDGKGRNSPFTAAFIKNVGDPDTDIRQMFFRVQDEVVRETNGKQRPEISVSLVGEYKLKITITLVNPGETAPPGGSAPIIVGPSEAERAWGFVKDTTSQEVLEDFIGRFPDSLYAKLAREKLEELKKKPQVAVITPPSVGPAEPSVSTHTGLLGYWPFNGIATDASGNGNSLVLNGDATFKAGMFGQALSLNGARGTTAQARANNTAFDFGLDDFTVRLWAKFNSITNGREETLIEKFSFGAGPGWTFTLGSGNSMQFYSPVIAFNSGPRPIPNGIWQQFIVERKGSTFSIYWDGLLVASATSSASLPPSPNPLLIGARNSADGRNFTVDGLIDEVAIWNRALSLAEIVQDWNGGYGVQLSSRN